MLTVEQKQQLITNKNVDYFSVPYLFGVNKKSEG